jgi:hypothetical protein
MYEFMQKISTPILLLNKKGKSLDLKTFTYIAVQKDNRAVKLFKNFILGSIVVLALVFSIF